MTSKKKASRSPRVAHPQRDITESPYLHVLIPERGSRVRAHIEHVTKRFENGDERRVLAEVRTVYRFRKDDPSGYLASRFLDDAYGPESEIDGRKELFRTIAKRVGLKELLPDTSLPWQPLLGWVPVLCEREEDFRVGRLSRTDTPAILVWRSTVGTP